MSLLEEPLLANVEDKFGGSPKFGWKDGFKEAKGGMREAMHEATSRMNIYACILYICITVYVCINIYIYTYM